MVESLPALFLKALMEKFPHPGMSAVLESAPDIYAAKFRVVPDRAGIVPELLLPSPERLLASIHPSWFQEMVQACPSALHSILSDAVSGTIQSMNNKALRSFLLGYLIAKWPDGKTLPVECVEECPLRWMALCDDEALSSVAELVSMPELVDSMRRIVDKKILQKILKPLSAGQQRYLRSLIHRPPRSVGINKELIALFVNEPEKGAEFLRAKGFETMGCALKNEAPLLVWHVLHRLRRDRALRLQDMMGEKLSDQQSELAKRSLVHAYQFLKKVEAP